MAEKSIGIQMRKYSVMTVIKKGIELIWYYFWGHILGAIFYKKKYYYGKHFKGELHGLTAPGWRWICIDFWGRKYNPDVPWPCSPRIVIGEYKTIHFHPDDLNNFQGSGNYFQSWIDGHIFIGKGTFIAPNVGLITSNHKISNLEEHEKPRDINIGEKCWIGMNSIILPGVTLGANTVVGAGSIVTKSFPQGNCVIAGNPARIIKEIE